MTTTEAKADDGEETIENVFADAPLDFEAIRGTRTFEQVLYSEAHGERTVPVNVLSGERTRKIAGSVERAQAFVADDPRRVAVPTSTETMIETQCGPITSTIFYGDKVVRGKIVGKHEHALPEFENNGHELEKTYRAADRSDEYEVELVETDYETGDVTIRATKAED